jgi:spore maturation protein CgeB
VESVKILCVFGEHNYGDPNRGLGYEYANFIPALRRLGHEATFFNSIARAPYRDFADLNGRLVTRVIAEKPDVVFFVLLSYEIWLETIDLLRKQSAALLIHWGTDDSWRYERFSRFVAPHFHAHATTCPAALAKAQKDGISNFVLTQWAANAANLAEPLAAEDCRYAVSFIGSAYGNRRKLISALRDRGIMVECFGHGWEHGPVATVEIPQIIRESVISLNFADSPLIMGDVMPGHSRQIKARVFEVPGAGGFLLTEPADGLEHYFVPGKEVAVYDGVADLSGKIRTYLSCPGERDEVAWAGHRRTRIEHTYDQRLAQLLEAAASLRLARSTGGKPDSEGVIDPDQFGRLQEFHRVGSGLRLLRRFLLSFGRLVWGPKRGPRAARRITYEVSCRLAGAKTYSVRGWPGRLFYHES